MRSTSGSRFRKRGDRGASDCAINDCAISDGAISDCAINDCGLNDRRAGVPISGPSQRIEVHHQPEWWSTSSAHHRTATQAVVVIGGVPPGATPDTSNHADNPVPPQSSFWGTLGDSFRTPGREQPRESATHRARTNGFQGTFRRIQSYSSVHGPIDTEIRSGR